MRMTGKYTIDVKGQNKIKLSFEQLEDLYGFLSNIFGDDYTPAKIGGFPEKYWVGDTPSDTYGSVTITYTGGEV